MSEDKDEVKRSLEPKEDEVVVRDRNNKLLTVLASSTEENAAAVEELLNSGACINAADENGNTPLHIAVQHSQIETVKLLLKKGASLEVANAAGITPLQMAASTPNSSLIFQLLLEKGANLYAVDQKGNTVLHTAAAIDNVSIIEKVIAENPSFHKIKNHLGDTPLHVAKSNHHDGSINKLLLLGADPHARNKLGQIPFPPRNAIDLDENEADKKQADIQLLEISQQPSQSHAPQPFERLKPSSILVSSASLKNLEERLLAERSYSEAFTDWVHESPGWAAVICIFIAPIYHVIKAAFYSDSSKKSIKNFINEFAVAVINGEVETLYNRPLEKAANSLPNGQIKDLAYEQIRESDKSLKNAVIDQKTQIKEILLQVFNDAPSSFLWNKKQLADLLDVKETENGEFFLVFDNFYEDTKEHYVKEEEEQCRYVAKFFVDFVQTVFGVSVKSAEVGISRSSIIEKRGTSFTCSVNIRDIYQAEVNKEVLQGYYQSFEVLAVLKEAIEDWAKQNKANQPLAKSINDDLKVTVNKHNKTVVVCSKFLDEDGIDVDSNLDSDQGRKAKREELEQKSKDYTHLMNSLESHLTQLFGEKAFNLIGNSEFNVDKGSFTFKQEIILTVPQKGFQFIFERKREETHLESEIFPPVFYPGKQPRQNAYLSEEQQQIKQFSALLNTLFKRNLNRPLIKNNLDFLEKMSLQSLTKDNVEYFELYSANCSSEQLTPDAYPLSLFQKVQALVNKYFDQTGSPEVLDLDIDENSQPPQLKLFLRKDRLNHLLERSEKKEEAEKVRDVLNNEFHRSFRLEATKNDKRYPDGTLFLAEPIEGKDEGNRNRLAAETAFELDASLNDKQPISEQFVNAASHGNGDSHQVFVCVYPDKFPRILDIMQANDLNLSL